jgi:hypothetical protein
MDIMAPRIKRLSGSARGRGQSILPPAEGGAAQRFRQQGRAGAGGAG